MKEDYVKIVDRSDIISVLKERLTLNPKSTAIIAVDMHRGHLDPQLATMPVAAEESKRVVENTVRLFNMARQVGMPIIHVVLTRRNIPGLGSEIMADPFRRTLTEAGLSLIPGRQSKIGDHNLEGSVQTEIMPELAPQTENEYVITSKKRFSCFYNTDLEVLLRVLKIDTVVIIGINTNTCCLATAFDAANRDLKVIMISDCVGSQYGNDLHILGLQNVQRALGWVLTLDEFAAKIGIA